MSSSCKPGAQAILILFLQTDMRYSFGSCCNLLSVLTGFLYSKLIFFVAHSSRTHSHVIYKGFINLSKSITLLCHGAQALLAVKL
jgi:hypothetical protein